MKVHVLDWQSKNCSDTRDQVQTHEKDYRLADCNHQMVFYYQLTESQVTDMNYIYSMTMYTRGLYTRFSFVLSSFMSAAPV